jgi:TRAP-type mannitol/chloroaromatic compound transport system permease large subunit
MTNDVLQALPLFLFWAIWSSAQHFDRLFQHPNAARHVPARSRCPHHLRDVATATGIVGAVVTPLGVLAYPATLRAATTCVSRPGNQAADAQILIPPSVMRSLAPPLANRWSALRRAPRRAFFWPMYVVT